MSKILFFSLLLWITFFGKNIFSAPQKILGIVLPLTGSSSTSGRKTLEAILTASKLLKNEGPDDLLLLIEDTASSELNAKKAVKKLSSSAWAILGPISSAEATSVAKESQNQGIVNVSLSVKEGISLLGSSIFQNAITARVQLEALVKFCVEKKNFTRFGILSPEDEFGEELSWVFWDSVEKFGGKVVAYETYDPDTSDYQEMALALGNLKHLSWRLEEVQKLNEYLQELKLKGVKNPKTSLPPQIFYDALFIADTPKKVGPIAGSLAYQDVVGKPLLGTVEWNSEQLFKRGGKFVVGSLFPGLFDLSSKNPKQKTFFSQFIESLNIQPSILSAQAYEATQLLYLALKKANSKSEVAQYLMNTQFEGPLGPISFDSNRLAKRAVPIFTLNPSGNIITSE